MVRAAAWLALSTALLSSACSSSEKRAPVQEASPPLQTVQAPAPEPEIHVVGAAEAQAPIRSIESGPSASVPPAKTGSPPPVLAQPKSTAEVPEFYQVQPGDNLFRIALDHGLDHRQLALWNGLGDPSRIKAGDRLRLIPANEMPEPSGEAPLTWAWPAKGEIIARFGSAAGSRGLDIAGQPGDPVHAAADGQVVYVGAGLRGYGKLIIIKHSRELLTAYGHNERILVTEGQSVKSGQKIAVMGDSDADRVKLHFEVREFGKPVDPLTFLPG